MIWTIDFAPLLPPIFFWVAGGLALFLAGLLLVRRSRGAFLRFAAMTALLVALANPLLREEEREQLASIAVVVMDESTSQALAGRPEQSRAIKADIEAKFGKIPNLEVKWVTAGRTGDTTVHGTHLFAALGKALADTPADRLAGVLLVTDGQVHDVPKSAAALGIDAPVHVLLSGASDEFDRRLEILAAPKYGLVQQTQNIELVVREYGSVPNAARALSLRVRREGQPDEILTPDAGVSVKIPMPLPHVGQNILEVELEPAPGELTPANNRVVVAMEAVRENLRVLLVSGEPHAGERTWRNLLKSDAAVDLVHFTILRPPEKQDGTRINELSLIAFPTRELFAEKIDEFDLIIFDRYEHRGILQPLYYRNIVRFVEEKGGALLIAAGDEFAGNTSLYRTPLTPVLPARPSGRVIERAFKPHTTAEGDRHPVTRDLPGGLPAPTATTPSRSGEPSWGHWFRQIDVQPDGGRILMNGAEDKPLLMLDRRGNGRVALLASDQVWLWARGYDGGGPHTDILRRLSHWLMKEPDLEEERLIVTAKGLKLMIERRSMEDRVPVVTLAGPGGGTDTVTLETLGPGVWQGTLDVGMPGLYKAETQGPDSLLTAVAHAGVEDPIEMGEVTATDKKLASLVEKTGGGIYWTRAVGTLVTATSRPDVPRITMLSNARVLAGSSWMGLKDRDAHVTRGVKLTPLFTGALALAALLALLSLAWWREGR